jgi:hypothetical protein
MLLTNPLSAEKGERMKLDFNQEEAVNKKLFIERLIEAGWKRHEAEEEWERIQKEEE